MKKILLLIAVLLTAVSCEKEVADITVEPTTYTFMYNVDEMDGVKMNITLIEFNNLDERVGSNPIDVGVNRVKKFTANERSIKVKVYLNIVTDKRSEYLWIQQVYYLTPNKDTVIEIENETLTGKSEP